MKRFNCFFLFSCICFLSTAQVIDPLKWSAVIEKLNQENRYEFSIRIEIEKGWHIYSIYHKKGSIGIPSLIRLENRNNFYEPQGKIQEIGKLQNII